MVVIERLLTLISLFCSLYSFIITKEYYVKIKCYLFTKSHIYINILFMFFIVPIYNEPCAALLLHIMTNSYDCISSTIY